jgi:ADP-glucose pyrophosphorylase
VLLKPVRGRKRAIDLELSNMVSPKVQPGCNCTRFRRALTHMSHIHDDFKVEKSLRAKKSTMHITVAPADIDTVRNRHQSH